MYRPVRPNNTLATLAAAFAALAVFTVLTGLMPVFFGSLSIMFALLSRGGELKLKMGALVSSVVSVLSMVAGIVLMVYAFNSVTNDPRMRTQLDQAFQSMYGVDYGEFWDQMENYYETGEMPEFMEELEKQ